MLLAAWATLGTLSVAPLLGLWAVLGALLATLGLLLGWSWPLLGHSWAALEALLAAFGPPKVFFKRHLLQKRHVHETP